MKFIDIIGSATSNMSRSKVRTGLTMLAIFIGAFTITLSVGMSSGVTDYLDKQVGSVGAKNVLIITRKVEVSISNELKKYDPDNTAVSSQSGMMDMSLNDKDVEIIKKQSGLSNFLAIPLVSSEYIVGENGVKYQSKFQPFVDGIQLEILSGKNISNKNDQKQILLPKAMVDDLGYSSFDDAAGKTMQIGIKNFYGEIKTTEAIISGVIEESLFTSDGMFVNKSLNAELYRLQSEGMPSEMQTTYMAVTAEHDLNYTADQISNIKNKLSDTGYSAMTIDDQIGIAKQIINAVTYVLIFFSSIALLAASIGIINTLYMSVQERTKEIGLMKAMGMSRFKVFLLFSVEAVLIGFWGSVIGSIAAIGVGQVVNKIASDSFLKDLPGFTLTYFPVLSVAAVILFIMFIAFMAGTLPSRKAANQDPIEALRYE